MRSMSLLQILQLQARTGGHPMDEYVNPQRKPENGIAEPTIHH
jgi:hypothetical protein